MFVPLLSDPFTPARHEIVELLVAIAIGYTEYYIPDGFPVEDFRRKVDDDMRASFLKHSSIAVRGAAAIAATQNNQQAEIIAPFCKLQSCRRRCQRICTKRFQLNDSLGDGVRCT